eukprot:TRINITY_DN18948_c0_g1_i5.p1 TRINITY_DN18948_c0_g1~~TRINITY_DN18948_c0_g1_i5.p1  ORF type:complete len:463 (-),score=83.77 TRINITY_DN18948_c0_g1_i5:105-1385(-)
MCIRDRLQDEFKGILTTVGLPLHVFAVGFVLAIGDYFGNAMLVTSFWHIPAAALLSYGAIKAAIYLRKSTTQTRVAVLLGLVSFLLHQGHGWWYAATVATVHSVTVMFGLICCWPAEGDDKTARIETVTYAKAVGKVALAVLCMIALEHWVTGVTGCIVVIAGVGTGVMASSVGSGLVVSALVFGVFCLWNNMGFVFLLVVLSIAVLMPAGNLLWSASSVGAVLTYWCYGDYWALMFCIYVYMLREVLAAEQAIAAHTAAHAEEDADNSDDETKPKKSKRGKKTKEEDDPAPTSGAEWTRVASLVAFSVVNGGFDASLFWGSFTTILVWLALSGKVTKRSASSWCMLALLYAYFEWGVFWSVAVTLVVFGTLSAFNACLHGIDWDELMKKVEEDEKLHEETVRKESSAWQSEDPNKAVALNSKVED